MDEFQLCHCCILKDEYSDIDILCCHSARVDISIKSPDIFFPTGLCVVIFICSEDEGESTHSNACA